MSVILSLALLFTLSMLLPYSTGEEIPAYICAKDLADVVESTALKWVNANESFTDYKYAVIGAYETEKSGESSIKRPVYVCRAAITMYVAGYLRPSDKMCLVAYEGLAYHRSEYQILINMGNKAKLTWIKHDKDTRIPQGAVSGGFFFFYMVGRVPSSYTDLTHVLGYWDELQIAGYNFVNETNGHMILEDGEVLVETENIAYEQEVTTITSTNTAGKTKTSGMKRTMSATTESFSTSTQETKKAVEPIEINSSEVTWKDRNNVDMTGQTGNYGYEQEGITTAPKTKTGRAKTSDIPGTTTAATESLLTNAQKIVEVVKPIKINFSEPTKKHVSNPNIMLSTTSTFSSSGLLLATIPLLGVMLL